MASYREQAELRIVIVGKTGSGKSALGNSLLLEPVFTSCAMGTSVTFRCDQGSRQLKDGRRMLVVDTPGLFDTNKTPAETQDQLVKCIALSAPGPHVFIFTLKVARVTDEELHTIDRFIQIFGEEVLDHVIIVFTDKEKLEYDEITIHDFLKKVPKGLTDLLKRCDYRYAAINNRYKGDGSKADVDYIMLLVQKTLGANHAKGRNNFYTSKMYKAAEIITNKKIAAIEDDKTRQQQVLQERIADLEAKNKSVMNSDVQIEQLREESEAVQNRDARSEVRTSIASSAMDMISSFSEVLLPMIVSIVKDVLKYKTAKLK